MDDNTTPMDEPDEDLARRLAAFATAPLDPTVAARCTSRLRNGMRARRRATRAAVLVAALVGTMLLSGVGLAAADTLPDPVQEVAHTTLAKVGVHVPPGHERYNDPVVCPGGPYKNHGAYVRAHKDDPAAGSSPCGKPTKSMSHTDAPGSDDESDSAAPDDGNEGTGPPPWAHGHSADHGKGEKKAKDEGDDDGADDAQDGTKDDAKDGAKGHDESAPQTPDTDAPVAAPTTIAPSPSTTVPPVTTTTTVAVQNGTTETSAPA